jgi:ribonuclease J
MNCLAIEQEDGILVVDCGVTFPDDDLGVDVLHPDFSWLRERASRVSGVFLTHGHEDHVGALPYLLADLDVPVWGPPHALGVARRRLAEHAFKASELDFREAHAGKSYDVGPFKVEPVRVAHSIVEASALAIATRAGVVLHSGDFNFDPAPPDGEPSDEARLRAIGDEGVALLLSDSTNIDVPVRAGSERSVADALERIATQATGRVVVAMFASNVQRMITFGALAQKLGRKLCLLGRSLDSQSSIATEIGRLNWPSDLLVSADRAKEVPRDRLLVLAGGTQGERNSAMRRLAQGIHPAFRLEAGDTVVLSSRVIPGNDRVVSGMVDELLRQGVALHSRHTDPDVHTSGHAGRSEQTRMIELVRPRCFLPVHGTLHHLLRHRELATSLGVERTLVVEDGTPVICDGEGLRAEEQVPHGKVRISMGGEPIDDATLRTRAELGRGGMVVVSVALDRNGRPLAPPSVISRGVPGFEEFDGARVLALEAARAIESYRPGRGFELREFVRRAVRRKVEDLSGTRPTVELLVNDADR